MSSNRTTLYNGDEVTIIFGPALIDSSGGYADGEFCTVVMESDDASDVAGTDGEVAVSRSNDRRATITVKLLQTALMNDVLSALRDAFVYVDAGIGGVHPIYIQDRNGTSLFTGQHAWIQRGPDVSYDREATSREWVIRCSNLVAHHGGNTTL